MNKTVAHTLAFSKAHLVVSLHDALTRDLGFVITQNIANLLFMLDTNAVSRGVPTIYSWRVPAPK